MVKQFYLLKKRLAQAKLFQFLRAELTNATKEVKNFWLTSWKRILLTSVILALSYSAILLANSYYWDDIFREIQGFRGWQDFSRHASNYLAILVNTSGRLIDIAPLTHFITIFLLSISCNLLVYIFKVRLANKKPTFFDILASLLLPLSPYYLECFVYKFDSPYIAVSVFASILPFLFLGVSRFTFLATSFIGVLLMCTTYQASSGIFPLIAIFIALTLYHSKKPLQLSPKSGKTTLPRFLILAAIPYCLAIICFKTLLMAPIDPNYASYVNNSVFPLGSLFSGFLGNLRAYYGYVISDFRTLWTALIALLIIGFVIFATAKSHQKKIPALIVTSVATVLALCLTFGLYPALEKPSFDPRAFLGLGATLSLFALYLSNLSHTLPLKLTSAALCYCFIVFAFIYGNALRQQDSWSYFRTSTLATDLGSLENMSNDSEKLVQITGNIGVAQPIENYVSATGCNILKRLTFIPLQSSEHAWGYYYLFNYFGLQNLAPDKKSYVQTLKDLKIIKDTEYHTISTSGNNILIELK